MNTINTANAAFYEESFDENIPKYLNLQINI